MGSLYRRKWKDKNGRVRESSVWWIKYYRDGRPFRESSGTEKKNEARRLLNSREGGVAKGLPITPKVTRVRFAELAEDVVNDYRVNSKPSLPDLQGRFRLHILPFFGHRRAASITTPDINKFVLGRQEAGASNGEINRELTAIKRTFSLGMQSAKILHRPHIPMLKENNVRQGFFECEEFEAVRSNLPESLRGIVTFAYITGWRVRSEVLTLEWRQVDFRTGTVSLDPGTTKNGEGRIFHFTAELRSMLEAQRACTDQVQRQEGRFVTRVFHRNGKAIAGFRKAWERACYNAGLPCKVETERRSDGTVRITKIKAQNILHDFRRTAVRNLVRAGVPEQVAMKMTGHKTRSVFERYNIVSPADLEEASRRLDKFYTAH